MNHPDLIQEVLYPSSTIREVWDNTISIYRETHEPKSCQLAAQLGIIDYLLSESNLDSLNTLWPKFDSFVKGWAAGKGMTVSTARRQKSYIAIMNKLALFMDKKKPLSSLADVLGYRIIIEGPKHDDKHSVASCYSVLNALIRFFSVDIDPPCSFMAAETRNGSELSLDLAQKNGIYIPARASILNGFANNVKDYVRHPKENGYQALHLFVQLQNRIVVEVQIRTSAMHAYAERGDSPANHAIHKQNRYSTLLIDPKNIDFSRLHIAGVSDSDDRVALVRSVPSFIGIPS